MSSGEEMYKSQRKPNVSSQTEDPWKELLSPLLKQEKERCAAWRDEVQNLLLLSGIFSAVVAVFIIDFQSSLKPNESIVLLTRIADSLDVLANGTTFTHSTLMDVNDVPSKASNQRIAGLWFVSLVFSLATVLVGIVSLQWIREYQRIPNGRGARMWFSLHHMHTEALDAWYLPQIFTFLPILLEFSLVFFFVGLCGYVKKFDVVVAIPSIIAIALALMFLVVTTMIPTIQALGLFSSTTRRHDQTPRVQCPYKSPQSWAFHRAVAFLVQFFSQFPIERVRHFFLHQDRRELLSSKLVHYPIHTIFFARKVGKQMWHLHDLGWPFQRDIDELYRRGLKDASNTINRLTTYKLKPLYDAVCALTKMRDDPATDSHQHVLINACFFDLTQPYDNATGATALDGERAYHQFVHHLLMDPNIGDADGSMKYRLRVPITFRTPQPTSLLRESINFAFRSTWNSHTARIPSAVRRDLLQQSLRLTEWMFSDCPKEVDGFEARLDLDYTPVTLLAHEVQADPSSFYAPDFELALKLADILRSFLRYAQTIVIPLDAGHSKSPTPTSFTSEYTNEFLSVSANLLGVAPAGDNVDSTLCLHLSETLNEAGNHLRDSLSLRAFQPTSSALSKRADYFFFVLYIFEQNLPTTSYRPLLRDSIAEYARYLCSLDPSQLDIGLANALKVDWTVFTKGWANTDAEPALGIFESIAQGGVSSAAKPLYPPEFHSSSRPASVTTISRLQRAINDGEASNQVQDSRCTSNAPLGNAGHVPDVMSTDDASINTRPEDPETRQIEVLVARR